MMFFDPQHPKFPSACTVFEVYMLFALTDAIMKKDSTLHIPGFSTTDIFAFLFPNAGHRTGYVSQIRRWLQSAPPDVLSEYIGYGLQEAGSWKNFAKDVSDPSADRRNTLKREKRYEPGPVGKLVATKKKKTAKVQTEAQAPSPSPPPPLPQAPVPGPSNQNVSTAPTLAVLHSILSELLKDQSFAH